MLRELRQGADKTLRDAAEWLGMGEPAVSKIEKGSRAIKAPTVRALCQLYDTDASTTDTLLRLVREANERGWWAAYRDTLPEWARQLVGLEAGAEEYWSYQSEYVPGLLQTPGYVAAITRALEPSYTDEMITRLVDLRLKRQSRLENGGSPQMVYYLNEAVLRRGVGGPEVMRNQLDHLVTASQQEHVTVRVVPFAVGAHSGMDGSFVMMQFPEETSPAFAYVENRRGAIYQEDPGDIESYTVVLDQLAEVALSEADSRAMLGDVARSQ